MKLTIRDVTKSLKGQLILGDPRAKVLRASIDSRAIQKGDVFFCIKGEKVDGHDFARMAIEKGAGAVVVSHLKWIDQQKKINAAVIRVENPQKGLNDLGKAIRTPFKGPVVGVTGSNGKTTTKQMIKQVLSELGTGLATQGNFNSQLGLPLVLSNLEKSNKWMVLEMGASEPGNISKLCEMGRPTVGVLTSIGPAHLATFGSMERIAESKWELMDSLPMDGHAILPWGLPLLESHIRSFKKKIVFYGEDSSCPVRATSIEVGEKIKFRLFIGSESALVTLPVSGRVNVFNALASAAAGWVLGCKTEKIAENLSLFQPPKMRMEVLKHSSGALIINDAYNANPASMVESARSLVETYPNKKRVLVLGTMLELGKESEKWHFHTGSDIGRFKYDNVFLIGKEMEAVIQGAVSVGGAKEIFKFENSKDDLAQSLSSHLNPETVILFKGSRGVGLEKVIDSLFGEKEPEEQT